MQLCRERGVNASRNGKDQRREGAYADGSMSAEGGESLLSTSEASKGAALAVWKKPTVAAARRSVGSMACDPDNIGGDFLVECCSTTDE